MKELLTCEEAQVLLERVRSGELEDAERQALERHLPGCAACRAWQAEVGRAEQALGARATQALETVTWPVLERVLARRKRRTVVAFGVAGVVMVLMNLGLLVLVGTQALEVHDVLTGLVPELVLVVGLFWFSQWLERRQYASRSVEQTLVALRGELERELRSGRVARWLLLGGAAFLGGVACWKPSSVKALVVLGGWALIPLAWFAWLHWRELPRLAREVADLSSRDT
jgi:anti-sigma factor RsiW